MNIFPPKSAWGDCRADMDVLSAFENFAGKDANQVFRVLDGGFLMRCIDLSYIPVAVFDYYCSAFFDYLICDDGQSNIFAVYANSMLDSIITWCERHNVLKEEVWCKHRQSLLRLIEIAEKFNLDPEGRDELLARLFIASNRSLPD